MSSELFPNLPAQAAAAADKVLVRRDSTIEAAPKFFWSPFTRAERDAFIVNYVVDYVYNHGPA